MRVLRPLVAFCLAILWTPLTVHCSLAAAGWLGSTEAASDACCDHEDACSHDRCSVIEEGDYTATALALKLSPPALCGLASETSRAFEVATVKAGPAWSWPEARAPDWIGAWHFVRRAVYPSRAPNPDV